MRIKQVGNKADKTVVVIRNAESTSTIPRGTPVVLVLNGTNDGLDVVLPATAGNALSGVARYGVATDSILASQYGESIVSGYVAYALITRMTRAATTDSWTSSASVASGIGLGIDTLNNAFVLGASQAATVASLPIAFLVDTLASSAASASATSDARTAITNAVRAFVKML